MKKVLANILIFVSILSFSTFPICAQDWPESNDNSELGFIPKLSYVSRTRFGGTSSNDDNPETSSEEETTFNNDNSELGSEEEHDYSCSMDFYLYLCCKKTHDCLMQ